MKKLLATATLFMLLVYSHVMLAQVIEKEHVTEELTIRPNYKNIIGYYTSWEWYKRSGLTSPLQMDFSKYTIINYSFFKPDTAGNLTGSDAWADSILLRGLFDYSSAIQPTYIPNTSLIDLAHVAGTKVMLSLGGWGSCQNFPIIAADPAKRANLAHHCVLALANYGFDGIDMDWEFPGSPELKGSPADKENYTLVMKAIRDSIDLYGSQIKYKFLLTGAFGSHDVFNQYIEWKKLNEFIDFFNIMSYDFNGGWSENASHNSPLSAPAQGDTNALDNTFYRLTTKYHVPANKINMGVGFYGRSLMGKAEQKLDICGTAHLGVADSVTFVPELGGSSYWNLMNLKDKFEEHWDEKAQVPYLIGKGDLNTFVSYDNSKSIKLKAEFVKQNDGAGLIIWEVSGDAIEKKTGSGIIDSTPLVDAINDSFVIPRKKRIPRRIQKPKIEKVKKEKGWRSKAIKDNLDKLYKP
jgi:GH18 family chitinase